MNRVDTNSALQLKMKKLLGRRIASISVFIALAASTVSAQGITSYTFASYSGTFTALSGATIPVLSGGGADDGWYNSIPVGFTFTYLGTQYATVAATTNGILAFGANLASGADTVNNLSANLSFNSARRLLAPLWDNLDMSSGQFSYMTTGTQPFRVFTAEWLNAKWGKLAAGAVISFQVKLHEGSNKIEFIYSQGGTAVNRASGGASIGITDSLTGASRFRSLNNATTNPSLSASASADTIGTKPATNQVYSFSPPAPTISSISPASGVVGSSVTITGTNFSSTAANDIVRFGNALATVTSAGTTSLTVTVPAGATYGPISVTTQGLTAYSTSAFGVSFNAIRNIDSAFFASKVNFSTGSVPNGIAIGDVDGDGKPDVVVVSYAGNKVSVYRNTSSTGGLSSGSFAAPVDLTTNTGPYAVALGDLNGDGKLDIVVSDTTAGTISLLGNKSSVVNINFQAKLDFTTTGTARGVAIADLDIDGKPEVVVANGTSFVSVFKNVSNVDSLTLRSFKPNVDFGVGGALIPIDIAAADFDGDGSPDVVTSNGVGSVSVLHNSSSPTGISLDGAGFAVIVTVGANPTGLVVADFDGDSRPDIATANLGSNTVSLARNSGPLTGQIGFQNINVAYNFAAGPNPFKITGADLDGDGRPDIVVVNRSVDSVSVFRNTATASAAFSSSSLASRVSFSTSNSPASVAIGDLDGDGKPDVVTSNSGAGSFSAFRNKAVRTETEPNSTAAQANSISIGETIQSTISANTDVDYYVFRGTAGDTLEVYGSPGANSDLLSWISVIDSVTGYILSTNAYISNNYIPSPSNPHSVFAITNTRTYYIRYTYAYNYSSSYPNGRIPDQPTMINSAKMSAAATASSDTGAYRLRFERFTPSAPDLQPYSSYYNLNYNSITLQTYVAPNGSTATVTFEYGTTPSFGSSVVASPQATGIVGSYPLANVTGLLPNTVYYFHAKATNSLGTTYSPTNSFQTPAPPQGWVFQTSGTTSSLYGVALSSTTTGTAVGDNNLILRTTNGGAAWNTLDPSPAYGNWYGVSFVGANTGTVVGYSYIGKGGIINTTDAGASWTEQSNNVNGSSPYYIRRVRFVNSTTGVAVSSEGQIVRTTDGGNTWFSLRSGGYPLNAVSFATSTAGFVVGDNGTFLRTTNGGANWDSLATGTTEYLLGAAFLDANTGIVVGGSGLIMRTTSGGQSWTTISQYNYNWLRDVAFSDANNGVAAGDYGAIVRTTDGGLTWTQQSSGTTNYLYGVSFFGRSATVVGQYGTILNYLDPVAETEPNNTAGTAQTISFRDEVNASIAPSGDVDFYRFFAVAGDTVEINVVDIDSLVVNGVLSLIGTDGSTVLTSNDDFILGDSTQSRIVWPIQVGAAPNGAGNYYAKFQAVSSTATGNYRIKLRKISPKPGLAFAGTASVLTTTSVTLAAPVNPNNLSTTVQFQYGPTTAYGTTVAADSSPISGQQLNTVTKTITGLTPFSEYHFRVIASNAAGSVTGGDVTFITSLGSQRSETEPNNTSSQANTIFIGDTVNGVISTNTDVDYYRFQAVAGDTLEIYSNPTGTSNLYARFEVWDSTAGNQVISNYAFPKYDTLHSVVRIFNTGIYHLRYFYLSNYNSYYPSGRFKDGLPRITTTLSSAATTATVDTGSYRFVLKRFSRSKPDVAQYIGYGILFSNSAQLSANVASNASNTTVSFEYGTTTSYGSSSPANENPLNQWYTEGASATLTGLAPGTTYHFRAVATNAFGSSASQDAGFTTSPAPDGWKVQQSTTSNYLYDISMATDSIGVAVGEFQILRTTNAGATWVPQTNPGAYLLGVSSKNKDTVMASGYSILRTTNGGSSWTYQQRPDPNGHLRSIKFVTGDTWVAAGQTGKIYRTTDGGANWAVVHTGSPDLWSFSFLNSTTGLLVGSQGVILKTTNGGAIWDSLAGGAGYDLYGVSYVDSTTAVACGTNGNIRRTTDGGTTWSSVSGGLGAYFYDVSFKNSTNGLMIGGNGYIFRSTDGGASWARQASGTDATMFGSAYIGRTAVVVGPSGLIMTNLDPLGELEPNNTTGQALAVNYEDQAEGTISPANDIDYYKFTAATNDTVEVKLTNINGSVLKGKIELVGTNGTTVLTFNDVFTPGDSIASRVAYPIGSGGVYYIKISGAVANSTGAYRIGLTKTSLVPVLYGTGSVTNVNPTSASLSATIAPNNLSTTIQFQYGLTTSYGTNINGNPNPINGQQRQTVTASLAGLLSYTNYHVRVVATNGAGTLTGPDLAFRTQRSSALSELEPNNDTSSAQIIFYGDSVNASISVNTDVDYYKFDGAVGDTVEAFGYPLGNSTLDGSYIRVLSSDGSNFADNNSFPNPTNVHVIGVLSQPGPYFLRYTYAYNYSGGFPNQASKSDMVVPNPIRSTAPSSAMIDTGAYRIYIRKFTRSAPDLNYYGYSYGISYNKAVVGWRVGSNGSNTSLTFDYGLTTGYGTQVAANENPIGGINQYNTFTAPMANLLPGTTYHYRATATNSSGTTIGPDYTIATPLSPEGWASQPNGFTGNLYGTHFINASTGYAVGDNGTILRTTNGGASWVSQSTGFFITMYSVWMTDANTVTIGASGRVFRTTDGGTNWSNVTIPYTVSRLQMKNTTDGIAATYSGRILRTTDGGGSWTNVRSTPYGLYGVSYANANTAFAAGGGGTIFHSSDGGATWDSLASGTTSYLYGIKFFDANKGLVVGQSGIIRRTTDGGTTWTNVNNSGGPSYYLYDIAFSDTSNGFAAGDGGAIRRTYDGGQTWVVQQSGTANTLRGASFSGKSAMAVGSYGTILNSVGLLATPSSLLASYASGNRVNVTWNDNATGESGYSVERKISSGAYSAVRTTSANATSIVDTVIRGRIYSYRIRAISASDSSAYSAEDTAFVPLAIPTSLSLTVASSTQINLSWQDTSDTRSGFRIERKTVAAGTYAQIDSVGSGVVSYQNTGLTPGAKYYYRIRSYNSDMASSYSSEVNANTALGRIVGKVISPNGWTNNSNFTVSWSSPTVSANAWVTVDAAPTASSLGTQTNLATATSFVRSITTTGPHWIYFYLADSSGNKDYKTYDSLLAQYDNAAPVVSHNNATLGSMTFNNGTVTPNSISIDATVAKQPGLSALVSTALEYKKTSDNNVITAPYSPLSGGSVSISNALFSTNAKPNGVDYRVVSTDQAGNVGTTPWYSISVVVQNTTPSDFVPPDAGTSTDNTALVKSYRMFSVPLNLQDQKPSSFMETTTGLGPHAQDGVNYVNWRMQQFVNGTAVDYEIFKNNPVVVPGTAFFLLSRVAKVITVGSGSLAKAQDTYNTGVAVTQGWNLIGDPFPFDFPADSLFAVVGSIATIAYYDGNGPDGGWWKYPATEAKTLKRWEGLAVNVTANTFIRFKSVPPGSSASPSSPAWVSPQQALEASERQSEGWLMKFDAQRDDNGMRDVGNTIGMVSNAKPGYDAMDSYQPPFMGIKNVALYFKNADGAMSDDIRPLNPTGEVWEMKLVTGDRAAHLKLNTEQVVKIPDPSFKAYLFDLDENMAHNLREVSQIEVNSKERIRNFRVGVGTKQYIDSVSASYGIDLIPKSMQLFNNYPNPFNPETMIRYTISGIEPSYHVTLKIYNILGQEVKSLVDREMEGGYYESKFDGRGLSSGVYFYRLIIQGSSKSSSFTDVKKMMLLK